MKKFRILSLALACVMILPLLFACGAANSGTPTTFSSVQVITRVDPLADPNATSEGAYSEYLFGENGEPLTVNVPDEGATVKDVVLAVDPNASFEGADLVSCKGIDNDSENRCYWGVKINGVDSSFDAAVQPEDKILIDFAK